MVKPTANNQSSYQCKQWSHFKYLNHPKEIQNISSGNVLIVGENQGVVFSPTYSQILVILPQTTDGWMSLVLVSYLIVACPVRIVALLHPG